MPKEIEIKIDSFEKEGKELGVYHFTEFYESKLFKARHRIVDKSIFGDIS